MNTIVYALVLLALGAGTVGLRRVADARAAAARAALLSGIATFTLAATLAAQQLLGAAAGSPADPLSIVLLAGATAALCAVSLCAPRAEIDAERLSRAFGMTLAFAAACLATDTRLLAVTLALSAVPLALHGRVAIVPFLGSASMAAGLFWLAATGQPHLPFAGGLGAGASGAAVALVWAGAWARLGLLPFHGWVPALFERSHPSKGVIAVVANPAVVVLLRVGPSIGWAQSGAGAVFTALAAVTALYGAFLCLGQRDLLRTVGWQAVAHAGLVVTGLLSRDPEGFAGAVVHVTASGVFLTGLTLASWSVRARFGRGATGVGERARHAGAAFLLFGLAAAGFPGTLGFVSEDLLLHGVLEHRPVVGAVLVAATALSAVALLRLFFRVFLGPPSTPTEGVPGFSRERIPDLFRREKVGLGLLLAALFGLGLLPGPALRAAERSAAIALWHPGSPASPPHR